MVDDASTDRTAEIAQSYEGVNIRLLEKQRSHIAVMNVGLEMIRGEYVYILHHDDFLLPGKLRRHVELMAADPRIGLSYSALWFVGPGGKPLGKLRSRVSRTDYVVDGSVELRYEAVQTHLHFGNVLLRPFGARISRRIRPRVDAGVRMGTLAQTGIEISGGVRRGSTFLLPPASGRAYVHGQR